MYDDYDDDDDDDDELIVEVWTSQSTGNRSFQWRCRRGAASG